MSDGIVSLPWRHRRDESLHFLRGCCRRGHFLGVEGPSLSLRLDTARFAQIAEEELAARAALLAVSIVIDESPEPWPLASVWQRQITLRKKPIQALVDTEGAVREIVRNLIRWAVEQRMAILA